MELFLTNLGATSIIALLFTALIKLIFKDKFFNEYYLDLSIIVCLVIFTLSSIGLVWI